MQGNVLDRLRGLPSKYLKTVITSSPYYKMRSYGTELQVWDGDKNCQHEWNYKTSMQHAGRGDGQKGGKYSEQVDYPDIPVKSASCKKCNAWLGELGQEPTRDLFLEHLWQICDEIMRVLEDDGTLWFNIGDKRDPDGSLYNIPHAFAEGMRVRGWSFLDDCIWFKRSVLPQSDPTVFSPDYEPIFHFSKRRVDPFYANGKLGIMQREEPPGTDGEEGRDWGWTLIEVDKKTYEMLKRKIENGEPLSSRFKEEAGSFYMKESYWKPYWYFHETQYEPYSEASLEQIQKAYTGKSKKHEKLQQTILFGSSEGVQNASDTKRSICKSIKENVDYAGKWDGSQVSALGDKNSTDAKRQFAEEAATGLPRFGGKKADGYGPGTYSGKPWTPGMGGSGSNIRGHSGILNADGEPALCGDPVFGRFMRTTWRDIPNELPSNFWDIIPARFAEAHFATFPVELVVRCLKTSCPEQVCTKCGLGWRKMYSEERRATRPGNDTNNGKSGTDADPNAGLHNSELSRKRETIIRRETGVMKCTCDAPTRPGIVLDPFMGSGTTAEAAIGIARDWLGIELNPEYIKLAMKRLADLLPQARLP